VQVPLIDVGRDEEVQRLRLADIGRAVGGEFEQPALVDLEAVLKTCLLLVAEEVEMLDRALVFEDRVPDALVFLAFFSSSCSR
jgi:hypothetical protein